MDALLATCISQLLSTLLTHGSICNCHFGFYNCVCRVDGFPIANQFDSTRQSRHPSNSCGADMWVALASESTYVYKRSARASHDLLTSPNSTRTQSHYHTSMDLFATLFSIQGVFDTPEAEPAPLLLLPWKPPSMVVTAMVASSRRCFLSHRGLRTGNALPGVEYSR